MIESKDNEELTKIGQCIKEKRESQDLTMKELSEKADISNAYISLLEKEKVSNPSVKVLKRIADALEIQLIELVQ